MQSSVLAGSLKRTLNASPALAAPAAAGGNLEKGGTVPEKAGAVPADGGNFFFQYDTVLRKGGPEFRKSAAPILRNGVGKLWNGVRIS